VPGPVHTAVSAQRDGAPMCCCRRRYEAPPLRCRYGNRPGFGTEVMPLELEGRAAGPVTPPAVVPNAVSFLDVEHAGDNVVSLV